MFTINEELVQQNMQEVIQINVPFALQPKHSGRFKLKLKMYISNTMDSQNIILSFTQKLFLSGTYYTNILVQIDVRLDIYVQKASILLFYVQQKRQDVLGCEYVLLLFIIIYFDAKRRKIFQPTKWKHQSIVGSVYDNINSGGALL
ncbi:Hypothetical_protein [Hexamita inflata]|uniref:Hypothetical_protein n=1 Tax=Hexamita inflata TaxID=28002 RepID=A0AA86PDE7_9EUKA|nr:Hypothetical protein HINF_LOCUS24649 [Hexamita inflata]